MALFLLFATAAVAQVIAPRRGDGTHGFNPRTNGFPQLAQVVHGPDGFAKRVDPGDAGAGCALFAQGRNFRRGGVVFGHGDDGLPRAVQPFGSVFVLRGGPLFGLLMLNSRFATASWRYVLLACCCPSSV